MEKFTLNLDGPLLKIPNSISSASFDYVSRYQIIAEIITRYFGASKVSKLEVLDVGGLGSILDQLIPVDTTILDNEVEEDSNTQTRGDGSHMQSIDDSSFDVVVTSDTLEHIPPKDRKSFVQELVRVSKELVIICAPFGDHGAAKEELKVQGFYTGFSGSPHRWLQEHADYGLPTEKEIVSYIPKSAASSTVVNHSNLNLWRQLMSINLLASDINNPSIHKSVEEINRLYNDQHLFNDFTENSYRTFIVISKSKEIIYKKPKEAATSSNNFQIYEKIGNFYSEVFKHFADIPLIINLRTQLRDSNNELEVINNKYNHLVNSKTWRYTEPGRAAIRKIKQNGSNNSRKEG